MFGPNQEVGCDGCSMFVDQIGHLAHLHARDVSFALISRAPIDKIERYRRRMGWAIPWYSSFESDFNVDFGHSPETPQEGVYQDGETFGLSVFVRDGDEVFRTYFTNRRGLEGSAASGRSSTSHRWAGRRTGRTHRRGIHRAHRTTGGAATMSAWGNPGSPADPPCGRALPFSRGLSRRATASSSLLCVCEPPAGQARLRR